MHKLESILAILLKESAVILPFFIHNPKSQQVEAVVLGEAGAVLNAVTNLNASKEPASN